MPPRELTWELTQLQNDEESSRLLYHGLRKKKRESSNKLYHGWHRMIENYSTRAITHETDKLPALSAPAARVAQKSKDILPASGKETYLSGYSRSKLIPILTMRARTLDGTVRSRYSLRPAGHGHLFRVRSHT